MKFYLVSGAIICASLLATVARAAESPAGESPAGAQELESITVTGNWLGSDTPPSVHNFSGARSLVDREQVESSGATVIGDVLRRLPGVQSTDNSSTAGSSISLNIGVRGLTGRYSPRSTVLLDGLPIGVAPYGQPQVSFAPVSLNNIQSIDVIRGGGAVRYGPQNVGGIINFKTRAIPRDPGAITAEGSVRYNDFAKGGEDSTTYSAFLGTQLDSGFGVALLYSGLNGSTWRKDSDERFDDVAVKFRQDLGASGELYGKVSYYDVRSRTPGGLTVAHACDCARNSVPRLPLRFARRARLANRCACWCEAPGWARFICIHGPASNRGAAAKPKGWSTFCSRSTAAC
jgi:Fe(3+) dicitrate transport protein